jgi:regulator of protease activity HflC (stomatin/prohibitin superfamily)
MDAYLRRTRRSTNVWFRRRWRRDWWEWLLSIAVAVAIAGLMLYFAGTDGLSDTVIFSEIDPAQVRQLAVDMILSGLLMVLTLLMLLSRAPKIMPNQVAVIESNDQVIGTARSGERPLLFRRRIRCSLPLNEQSVECDKIDAVMRPGICVKARITAKYQIRNNQRCIRLAANGIKDLALDMRRRVEESTKLTLRELYFREDYLGMGADGKSPQDVNARLRERLQATLDNWGIQVKDVSLDVQLTVPGQYIPPA